MSPLEFMLRLIESLVVAYTLCYAGFNLTLLLAGFQRVRRSVRGLGFEDLDMMDDRAIPGIAVLVPAFNEAASIVDSVRALTELDYPRLEIIVINDGSRDATKQMLRQAFRMRRRDISMRNELHCAQVLGVYEATVELPESVTRLVLVDKSNGGKADSLNAGLNVSISPYFISVDADSILDPLALKQIVRVFQEQPDTIAAGGQVGIVNDCTLEDGHITRRSIPRSYLPLCQTVEYVRSFSIARTGFSRLNALIILSGAFMVMTRDAAMRVGGFLTGRSRYRLLDEYVGVGQSTICEDMEIIVRLHRYEKECGRSGRVVHTPMPVCWTELPEDAVSLGKQRRRWHRGLIEILRANRSMFLNPDYGRVGLLAMPYFVYFELLGPYVELGGWILLPLLSALGFIDPLRAALILSIAVGSGVLQSLLAVMSATWLEPVSPAGHHMRSMLGTDRWRDRILLLAGCFLSELGYRQMTLLWRIRATWDYFAGHTGWDKFERKGFKSKVTAAAIALALLFIPNAVSAADPPQHSVTVLLGQDAQRDGIHGWWTEAIGQQRRARTSWHVGAYRFERERRSDHGVILGVGGRLARAGAGLELRLAPGAVASPERTIAAETEVGLGAGFSFTARASHSQYEALRVLTMGPGIVAYRGNGWLALRAIWWDTSFDAGEDDLLLGWSAMAFTPMLGRELRWSAGYGGESYARAQGADPGRLRATTWGVELRQPVGSSWTALLGAVHRLPERGAANVYVQLGAIRSW